MATTTTAINTITMMELMRINNCSMVINPQSEKAGWLSIKVVNNKSKKEVEQLVPYTMADISTIVFCADFCIKKLLTKKVKTKNGNKKK